MDYEIIRSKRRSVAIEVKGGGEIIVRAPFWLSQKKIDEFVLSKTDWIEKAKIRVEQRKSFEPDAEECKRLKKLEQEYIPPKVLEFSNIMGLYPNSVKITSAKTRHGSCSGKNNLCFSYRLMRYPKAAVDYVIVHELAHIKHKNHQKEFYKLIEKYMPDYKARERILKNINEPQKNGQLS